MTAKYNYRSVVRFRPIQLGGGGGVHMLLVILNTLMFLFEVGGPLGMPTTYYPYPSPCLLLPLLLPLPTMYIPLLLPLPTTYIPLLLPLPTTYIPLLLPLPTTTPTPPLTYYSPGAWSEVTSKVTYVMMTNSLIHYCQSMKHIYMDTVYKLS